jgi:hypothetical protein
MQPTKPHPLDYQPPQRSRRQFLARPFWRDYGIAYLLIGFGFLLGDVASAPSANHLLKLASTVIFFAGLLVFATALSYSVWFIAGGKPPRNGAP